MQGLCALFNSPQGSYQTPPCRGDELWRSGSLDVEVQVGERGVLGLAQPHIRRRDPRTAPPAKATEESEAGGVYIV